MGLDITACSHLELAREVPDFREVSDSEWNDDFEWVYDNKDFDRIDGHPQGFYRSTEETESISFKAGSYGTYNGWRADLAQMAMGIRPEEVWVDEESFAGRPFVELIHFSDCEGAIGPEISAKLAKDFADYEEKAKEWSKGHFADWPDEGEIWIYKYENWKRAFELAAQGGFVMFH